MNPLDLAVALANLHERERELEKALRLRLRRSEDQPESFRVRDTRWAAAIHGWAAAGRAEPQRSTEPQRVRVAVQR
jgi:hypothetical protein